MPIYKDHFSYDYLLLYRHRTQKQAQIEINWVVDTLNIKSAQRILDLSCGEGQHTIELYKHNLEVTGLDISETLLTKARKQYPEIQFIYADMRKIPFRNFFHSIIMMFTSFGYFDDEKENLLVLESIERALRPGGKFLLNLLNRKYIINNLIPVSEQEIEGMRVLERYYLDAEKKHILKQITIIGEENRSYKESIRLYTIEEIKNMFEKSALKLENVYGDYCIDTYDEDNNPRMIVQGYKPI